MSLKQYLVLLSTIAAIGCGGSGSESGAGPSITSFTATPASLPAGGGNVTLSWSVSGASALSIDQGVGDVTGMTSKVVAVTSSRTFTLTATHGAASNTEHATVNVAATSTVSGKVLNRIGQPVSGATVSIPGKATVTTDANGAFTVQGVTAPYDVLVVETTYKVITAYKGLTRADPTLLSLGALTGAAYAAHIAGTVQGGGVGTYPQPAGHHTPVALASPQASVAALTEGSGAFTLIPQWYGQTSTQGSLHAFQIRESVPGTPVEYRGYGKLDLVVSNGGSYGAQNVALSPVSAATLSGSVTVPAGYTLGGKSALIYFNPSTQITLAYANTPATSFNFLVPVIPNTGLLLQAYANKLGVSTTLAFKGSLSPNASGVNLTIRSGVEASLPADGATGVSYSTPFSWSAFTEGVHILVFLPGTPDKPLFYVFTAGTSTTIPDGRSFGISLPSGTTYYWNVHGYAPFATIDAAATPDFWMPYNNEVSGDLYTSSSAQRIFTTAP